MEKEYVYSVIILIGGDRLPDESIKQYLGRVSLYTGLSYRVVRDAYYGQDIGPNVFISAKTRQKLEEAAQRVRRPHALIAYIEHHVAVWEADPARHGAWIDASRRLLDELHQPAETHRGSDQLARDRDVGGRGRAGEAAGTAAAGLALAAATN